MSRRDLFAVEEPRKPRTRLAHTSLVSSSFAERTGALPARAETGYLPRGDGPQVYDDAVPRCSPRQTTGGTLPRSSAVDAASARRTLNLKRTSFNSASTRCDQAYWLKAIWDRQPPFSYDLWSWDGVEAWKTSTNNSIAFESGDAESGAPKMFEVKAKESVSVRLECRTIE